MSEEKKIYGSPDSDPIIWVGDDDGHRYTKQELFERETDTPPMDKFQIRQFVIQQALTPYKQIHQCQMEIDSRKSGLKEYEFTMRELAADIAIYEERVENTPEGPQKDKYKVKLERVQWNYEKKKGDKERLEYEIKIILEMFQELTDKLSFEEMEDNKEALELDYWKTRMSKQAAVDVLSHGVVGVGNMLSIMDMPKEVMEETLSLTHKKAEAIRHELPDSVGSKLFQLGAPVARQLELEMSKDEVQGLLNSSFLDVDVINKDEETAQIAGQESTKE